MKENHGFFFLINASVTFSKSLDGHHIFSLLAKTRGTFSANSTCERKRRSHVIFHMWRQPKNHTHGWASLKFSLENKLVLVSKWKQTLVFEDDNNSGWSWPWNQLSWFVYAVVAKRQFHVYRWTLYMKLYISHLGEKIFHYACLGPCLLKFG